MPREIEDMDLGNEVSDIKDEAGASTDAELPASAGSSTATDVSKTEGSDALSVVRNVVGERGEEQAAASSAEGEEEGGQEPDERFREPDNESYSDVPFNKHPRFQEVLRKWKDADTDATRYRNVQGFLDQQGLGAEEAAELLTIGGLIKRDPVQAWARIKPTIAKLLIAVGEVLPEDLRQQVQNGMSESAAFEVARSRAQVSSMQRAVTFDQQMAERRQQVEQQSAIVAAVESWEAARRRADPNFDAKLPSLQKEISWLHRSEGVPSTPQAVEAQLRKAYETVNTSAAPTQAAPARRQPVAPVRGGRVAGQASPTGGSTLDIIKSVVAQRG
ncbi:hypothetical protein NPA31_011890 [Aurantimonas sp. MSK8Z-1]|uniref:hypothetical protein n=1 Tax=Mangrovibrevibacter kandeliae TaxID=2968473 RepID=UPI00211902F9|nr:hypothetical protein [Aurantimonas sp. MSK8Z-1]MCW4115665.1 hypothetical protein [Aurantimonas sp. MSK8Z-1]